MLKKIKVLFVSLLYTVSSFGQEKKYEIGEVYSNFQPPGCQMILPPLTRTRVPVTKGENFQRMFTLFLNPVDKERGEAVSGPITALSVNSDGNCLVVGFTGSMMAVLDRKKGALSVFTLPGVVRSLLLDPTESFVTVACDADLYNVGYKNKELALLHITAHHADFFGLSDDIKKVQKLLTEDVPKLEFPSAIPKTKHVCTFESMGKYIILYGPRGGLLIDPSLSSYAESFDDTPSTGGGVTAFLVKDEVKTITVGNGQLVAMHDNAQLCAITNQKRDTIGIKEVEGKVRHFVNFSSLVSSLMAIQEKKYCYLIGTETGEVYYYDANKGQKTKVNMQNAPRKKSFSILTCNAKGTIAIGAIASDLYFGLLPG